VASRSRNEAAAAGDESAAYRRLEADQEKPAPLLRDHSAAWEKLRPLATLNGALRERVESFAASKRITLEALEALDTRIDVRGKGPEIRLAWASTTLIGGRRVVTAVKFRNIATGERQALKPSVFVRPLVVGNTETLDIFAAEGETDAARLYGLVGDLAAVMVLPAGALTWKRAWENWLPRGATLHLCHDADERGDEGATKAAKLLTGRTVRVRPPVEGGDWCDWDGGREEFIQLVGAARADNGRLFDVLTARQLCALPDPPESDELLGPVLMRAQRTIIGGHTGEGKTTYALQLVRALVRGETFLDWQGQGGRVLVLDAEQGLRSVKRRLREARLDDCDDVDYVRVPDGLSLDSDPRHIAAVEEKLEAGNFAAVVADPLYKLHQGDSNDEREAVDLMRRFDGWRERHRFALVLPVHCRKPVPGTKFSIHDLFGSSAYVRGAEVVLGLQRVSDGYAKLHFLKDRDGDLPIGAAWGLLFNREEGFRRDPNDGTPRETATDKIRALLEEDPTLSPKQLEEAAGYAERTVRKALKAIREKHSEPLFDDSAQG
jgi:hypothetical protein